MVRLTLMNEIRRSIQDIIPPARSKPIRSVVKQESTPAAPGGASMPPPSKPPRAPRGTSGSNVGGLLLAALVVVVVIGTAFGVVSTVFHRATVSIELNRYAVTVTDSFDATPDGATLSYSVKSVEEVRSVTVPQSGTEQVQASAEGTIVIFNEYSTSSQRLIANTRFETPEGLIYRVRSAVTVPGYKTVSGKKVPGEVEVKVFADQPGERYNLPTATFTIPGLKGSPQFDGMFARSKGPIQGGFVGERAVVDPAVRDAAVAELKKGIEEAARERYLASRNAGEIVFPSTITVDVVERPDVPGDSGAVVTLAAVAQSPVFSEASLASVFASLGNITAEGPLAIENLSELSVAIDSPEEGSTIRLTVSGEVRLVGVVDVEKLARDLAGKSKREVGSVLSGYPGIADMKISIYPFWRDALPKEAGRISVSPEEGAE